MPLRLPPLPLASPAPLLLGYSGGLDSSVLLHLLAGDPDAAGRLRAIHVHHGLSPHADDWAAHCRRECERLGVPLRVVQVHVDGGSGLGPEASAREARHRAFAGALRAGEVLVLAHHRDDQAETVLLRALRGSGPDGLAAMRAWRAFAPGWLWRPLLALPRERLLEHARDHRLAWIDDPSNAELHLDRNFLRHRVLPLLRERWPHAASAFARAAALQAEAVELLSGEDAAVLAAARTDDPAGLRISALRDCPPARRARVLRHWIALLGLPPLPRMGIDMIEGHLLDGHDDRIPAFAWNGAIIRRWRARLWAEREQAALPADMRIEWDGDTPLRLPTGDLLRLDGVRCFPFAVTVHARHGGERIVQPGRHHSHALKHVLQSLDLPPWQRERMPLLSDADGNLLAAGDRVFSASFDAWLQAGGHRLHWQRNAHPSP